MRTLRRISPAISCCARSLRRPRSCRLRPRRSTRRRSTTGFSRASVRAMRFGRSTRPATPARSRTASRKPRADGRVAGIAAGRRNGDKIQPLMDRIYRVRTGGDTFYAVERDGDVRRADLRGGSLFDGYSLGAAVHGGLAGLTVLAPVQPSKMICVGLNYRDHAAEMRKALPPEPLLFFKPSTCVLDPGRSIKLPPGVGRVDHEAELAVVIGRRAHRVKQANAWDYILGVTCVNDVTAREIQNKETQYTRAKGFDTFGPVGPCVATGLNGAPRTVEGWVNGTRRQSSTTGQLIFPIDFLVEYITFVMTLEPGDIISTGTPSGVGPLQAGDTVTVKVEGVGDLTNPVEEE